MDFEPVFRIPTAWSSACGQLAVHLFEGTLSVDEMNGLLSAGSQWTARHPGRRVEVVVVLPSTARMSHEERVRMGELIRHGEQQRAASATVILAEGILASVQRSVLTGLMMLSPAPHPAKVFGSLTDAAPWLLPFVQRLGAPRLQLDEFASSLDAHLNAFRARADRPRISHQPERRVS